MCKVGNFLRFLSKLDQPPPVTRTGGYKGKNSLVPRTSFVPVSGNSRLFMTLRIDYFLPDYWLIRKQSYLGTEGVYLEKTEKTEFLCEFKR